MRRYIIEIHTSMMLAKMMRLMGRIEKIINDQDQTVKFISVHEIEIEEDR